jgi:hypothetical protein
VLPVPWPFVTFWGAIPKTPRRFGQPRTVFPRAFFGWYSRAAPQTKRVITIKRVAIYLRVSTSKQEISNQRR